MSHTIESLRAGWKAFTAQGKGSRDTSDPVLLAGLYIDWASGDLDYATRTVETHVSGQYLDRPPFPGCTETLKLLQGLKP